MTAINRSVSSPFAGVRVCSRCRTDLGSEKESQKKQSFMMQMGLTPLGIVLRPPKTIEHVFRHHCSVESEVTG